MSKYFINKYIKYNNLVVNIANKIQTFNCFCYYYLKRLFKDMLKFHGSWSHWAFVIIEAVFSQQVLWFGLIPLIKGIRFPSVVSQQAALGMAYHWAKNQSVNRYRREGPKVDESIFDSALSHTRRSNASEKKRRK